MSSNEMREITEQGASARRWTWIGMLLAIVFIGLLVAFVFVPNRQPGGDNVGEDDAGVVHPDPIGGDEDVTPAP